MLTLSRPLLATGPVVPLGACADAGTSYRQVQHSLLAALAAYRTCVSDYFGASDCATTFARLQKSQEDFVTAVDVKSVQCAQ